MRISIIDLLALMFLTSLAMTIFKERQVVAAIASDSAILQAAIEQTADDCRKKEREIELFTRTINKRETDLHRMSLAVDQTAQLFNQVALRTVALAPRDNMVSIRQVPTFSRSDEFRERKKIHVPDGLAYELRLSFVDRDGNLGCYEGFEKPKQQSVPLVKGENLIEIFFDGFRVPNSYTLTNHTNGDFIRVHSKNVHGGGRTFGVGQGTAGQKNFSPGVELPWVSAVYVGPNSQVVVQMVESKR